MLRRSEGQYIDQIIQEAMNDPGNNSTIENPLGDKFMSFVSPFGKILDKGVSFQVVCVCVNVCLYEITIAKIHTVNK